MSFWDIIWFILVTFAFVAYLMVLFSIIGDLFRRDQSGWIKALWIIFLIFLPFLSALIYLLVNGQGMSRRSMEQAQQFREAQDAYIRDVAGAGAGQSPADQIAHAKTLLDAGTITEQEFQALKAKALR